MGPVPEELDISQRLVTSFSMCARGLVSSCYKVVVVSQEKLVLVVVLVVVVIGLIW